MIRGAALLTVGFGLGYIKALYDQDDIRRVFGTIVDLLKEEAKERAERTDEATKDPRAEAARLREQARRIEDELDDETPSKGENS